MTAESLGARAGEASGRLDAQLPLQIMLRGIGQVFFQENALTGACFLLGIALNSPLMAAGAAAGSALGAATAWLLGFDRSEVRAGIYGFNATLVGIATFFFFAPGPISIGLGVVGCVVSTLVTWAMRRFLPFPTYTLPFIVTTWGLFFLGLALGLTAIPAAKVTVPADLLHAVAEGISEVMLQANIGTGLLFLLGIALNDWRHAAWTALASLIGMLGAIYHEDPAANIAIGLYGYNATLAAIALFLWRRTLLAPLLGILISVPLTEYFVLTGLPTLTAPFVLATWIVLALGWAEARLFRATGGVPGPGAPPVTT